MLDCGDWRQAIESAKNGQVNLSEWMRCLPTAIARAVRQTWLPVSAMLEKHCFEKKLGW